MKAVLYSIHSGHCSRIVNGVKKVEVRKSIPKLEFPFKCYIYCTIGREVLYRSKSTGNIILTSGKKRNALLRNLHEELNGKVIGEFICEGIDEFTPTGKGVRFERFSALKETCLSVSDINAYLGEKKGYGIRVSDLIVYDSPRELKEFLIKRAPQSWCYVEEKECIK